MSCSSQSLLLLVSSFGNTIVNVYVRSVYEYNDSTQNGGGSREEGFDADMEDGRCITKTNCDTQSFVLGFTLLGNTLFGPQIWVKPRYMVMGVSYVSF